MEKFEASLPKEVSSHSRKTLKEKCQEKCLGVFPIQVDVYTSTSYSNKGGEDSQRKTPISQKTNGGKSKNFGSVRPSVKKRSGNR